jgi:hypothetical protein
MKHYFGGILRRIYKPSKKFFIKSPYDMDMGHTDTSHTDTDMSHIRICQNAPTPSSEVRLGNFLENIQDFRPTHFISKRPNFLTFFQFLEL